VLHTAGVDLPDSGWCQWLILSVTNYFHRFNKASNIEDTTGMTKHRLKRYIWNNKFTVQQFTHCDDKAFKALTTVLRMVIRNLNFYVPWYYGPSVTHSLFMAHFRLKTYLFSERELMFMFAICRRPSVCLSSVTFVHPTQTIQIFGNVSAPCNTRWPDNIQVKFYGDRPRGTPPSGG